MTRGVGSPVRGEGHASREREYRDRDRIEIVLVGSDSLETVRFTPANYFDGPVTVSKYLAGI